jgi:hypothetical protein
MAIAGDEAITATLLQPHTRSFFQMTACLRGPGLKAMEQDVYAMLASVTLS